MEIDTIIKGYVMSDYNSFNNDLLSYYSSTRDMMFDLLTIVVMINLLFFVGIYLLNISKYK